MLHPHLGDRMGLEYDKKKNKSARAIFLEANLRDAKQIQQQIKKGRILLVCLLWPRQQNLIKFMCRCEFCDLFSILWMNIDRVYLYLYLSIQLSICIRFLSIYLPIFITISPPIYISTYLSLYFSPWEWATIKTKTNWKCTLQCAELQKDPTDLWKCLWHSRSFSLRFEAAVRNSPHSWETGSKSTWKGHTSSFAILNRTKGKTWRAVRKE